jgi:3-phenylpropionate/trans-cinnamate dioxygenase ferredoxin subunit
VTLGPSNAVPDGEARAFEVEDESVLVCRVAGRCYAVENVCTHDDAPLGGGGLEGHEVVCPRHGARFDVRTGKATRMPAIASVSTYAVHEENGEISVDVD